MNFKEKLETLSDDELNLSIEETEKNINVMVKAVASMDAQILLFEHAIKLINEEKQKRVNANRKEFKVVK